MAIIVKPCGIHIGAIAQENQITSAGVLEESNHQTQIEQTELF
jgi:hypothetical protein